MTTRRALPTLLVGLCALSACKKAEVESYRVPKETVAQPASPHAHGGMPPAGSGATPPAAGAPSAPGGMGGAMGGGSMASTPVATASGAALTWTPPAHWQTKTGSAMRKATYVATGEGGATAELAVTAFPGDVGGELANLNRWRGQINLPPVGQAEFEAAVQRLERNGLKISVVDIAGTGAAAMRILGASVPIGGATWFFKMQGPAAVVGQEKAAFMALLDTIKPSEPAK